VNYVIRKGTTSKILLVYARQLHGSGGATGLMTRLSEAGAAVIREGEPRAMPIPLTRGEAGVYREGSLAELDPEVMPGVHQFGVPDAALADGADAALIVFRVADAVIEPVHLSLVAYDPQDGDRMGMTAIGPEQRIAALRGAFPLLTQRELDEVLARRGSR
jgi:hypothetical protein